MEAFFKNATEIIRASGTPLTLLALAVLTYVFLAFVFFRQAPNGTRLIVFSVITSVFIALGAGLIAPSVVFQSVEIRSGRFEEHVRAPDWNLFEHPNTNRKYRQTIRFDPPLSGAPTVMLGLTRIDVDKGQTRVRATVVEDSTTNREFQIEYEVWGDTQAPGLAVDWLAYYTPQKSSEQTVTESSPVR